MKTQLQTLLVLLLCFAAAPATYGEVFRCVDAEGFTVFSDVPCTPVIIDEVTAEDILALQERETEQLETRLEDIDIRLVQLQLGIDDLNHQQHKQLIDVETNTDNPVEMYKRQNDIRKSFRAQIDKNLAEISKLRNERERLLATHIDSQSAP